MVTNDDRLKMFARGGLFGMRGGIRWCWIHGQPQRNALRNESPRNEKLLSCPSCGSETFRVRNLRNLRTEPFFLRVRDRRTSLRPLAQDTASCYSQRVPLIQRRDSE
jgi:hypothetical protein